MRTLVVLLAVATLAACDAELPSRWAGAAIVVDGQPDEWEQIPLYHFEGHDFAFAVQNDAENLYVYTSTPNQRDQELLSRLGLTLWLNPEGEKEETRGIRFWPKAPRRPAPQFDSGPVDGRGGPPEFEDSPRLRRPSVQTVRNETASEIAAEVGEMYFRGNLALEIRFPLRAGVSKLAFGFAVPESPRQARPMSKGRGKGGKGMGRGGMPRGGKGGMRGMGGETGGAGPNGRPDDGKDKKRGRPDQVAPASEVIWVIVVPATPPA